MRLTDKYHRGVPTDRPAPWRVPPELFEAARNTRATMMANPAPAPPVSAGASAAQIANYGGAFQDTVQGPEEIDQRTLQPLGATEFIPIYRAQDFSATDGAGGIINAYNAAHAAGGGIVLFSGTVSVTAHGHGIFWFDPNVQLWGTGPSATLLGTATTTIAVLTVQIPIASPGGQFRNFTVDGGGFAANPILEVAGATLPITVTGVAIANGTTSYTITTGLAITAGMLLLVSAGNGVLPNNATQVVSYDSGTGALVIGTAPTGGSGTSSLIFYNEGSVGTLWFNVGTQNASALTNDAWLNWGCEDNLYEGIRHPGNENTPSTVGQAFRAYVANGSIDFIKCDLFGRVMLRFQMATILGGVMGPILIDNPGPNTVTSMYLAGVYVYDGGNVAKCCIDTSTNMCNIVADACYFVANVETNFINGNVPVSNTVALNGCSYVQGTATGTTLNLFHGSGSGNVIFNGGGASLNNATTVNLASISGGTVIVTMPVLVAGVTAVGTSRAVSTPSFPATTVAQKNTFDVPVMAYVVAGVGAVTVAIDTTTVQVVPAAGATSFRLDPGSSFTPTYSSGTPTWVWMAV